METDLFAGEHTSTKWQSYVNGAIESRLRAAEEILGTGGLFVADSK